MSSNFSANQFEGTFSPKKLQNWCVTGKPDPKRPAAQKGFTSFIVDERGHLLPGVKKGNVYPNFKGTWDHPCRIPGVINPTARSVEGIRRLKKWGFCEDTDEAKSPVHKDNSCPDADEQVCVNEQHDAPAPNENQTTSPKPNTPTTSPVLEANQQSHDLCNQTKPEQTI